VSRTSAVLTSRGHRRVGQNFHVGIKLEQVLDPLPGNRTRKTKIVCAIGPACSTVDMLGE
jgi:hypothetical protein